MPTSPGIILPHIDQGVLWVSGGTAGPGVDGGQPDPSRGAETLDNGEATSELMPAEDNAMGDGESMTDDSMPNTGTGGLVEGSGIGATLAALIALAALAAAASVYWVARVAVRRR